MRGFLCARISSHTRDNCAKHCRTPHLTHLVANDPYSGQNESILLLLLLRRRRRKSYQTLEYRCILRRLLSVMSLKLLLARCIRSSLALTCQNKTLFRILSEFRKLRNSKLFIEIRKK